MKRSEAYHILGKMMDDATVEQNEALTIAMNDIEFIDLMPLDDWAPLLHGRWGKNAEDDNIVYCDQCYMPQDMPTPYCHYCGAKMDGGADNG